MGLVKQTFQEIQDTAAGIFRLSGLFAELDTVRWCRGSFGRGLSTLRLSRFPSFFRLAFLAYSNRTKVFESRDSHLMYIS
mgnify:CR=1 FL=1